MKMFFKTLFMGLGLAGILFGTVFASAENEYPNGIEGIKAASLPPPGFYYKMYNVYYNADTMNDPDGNKLNVDFDLNLFANAHRFLWVSDIKILEADFAADLIVPIFNVDIEIGAMGIKDDEFGLGDICIEPFVLAWHGPRYDAAFGIGIYAPTGKYDKNAPASPGKDMWTGLFTLGGTYYFDTERTLSASILARYEMHGEKKDTDITPGDDFHFEWGIGKNLGVWEAGLSGYCQWQVSEDSGDGASNNKDQVYAAGPEVSFFIPSVKLFITARSLWEFEAEDRSEGNFTCLTFTKIF